MSRRPDLVGGRQMRHAMVKDLKAADMLSLKNDRPIELQFAPYPAATFEALMEELAGDGLCRGCLTLEHLCDADDPPDQHHPRCLVPLKQACDRAARESADGDR